MRLIAVLATLATGCGRIGFGATSDGAHDRDGPIQLDDAGHRLVSFGETGTATYSNVTADTFLEGAHVGFNYGAGAGVESESNIVGLIRFELSALPPDQSILAAKLVLFAQAGNAVTVDLYRVIEAWTEGAAIGNPGAASWTERVSGVPWTTPGAGTPGSRDNVSLATFQPLTDQTSIEIPLDAAGIAVVQGWIANPSSNDGLAIVTIGPDGALWDFTSRENPTLVHRPLFVLTLP